MALETGGGGSREPSPGARQVRFGRGQSHSGGEGGAGGGSEGRTGAQSAREAARTDSLPRADPPHMWQVIRLEERGCRGGGGCQGGGGTQRDMDGSGKEEYGGERVTGKEGFRGGYGGGWSDTGGPRRYGRAKGTRRNTEGHGRATTDRRLRRVRNFLPGLIGRH